MPAAYAHHRFGCDLLARLDAPLRRRITPRALFDCGVHGPDVLFYYKPLSANPVSGLGYATHKLTGRVFFEQAARACADHPDKEAAFSYLCGVLCHFALDRECHPYVGKLERAGGSHLKIEAFFERYLMEKDGKDPLRTRQAEPLDPAGADAGVIAPFWPPLTEKEVAKAQRSQVWFLDLLCPPPGLRRKLTRGLIRLTGKKSLADLVLPESPDAAFEESSEQLWELYQGALPLAEELIRQFDRHLAEGTPLGSGFDHTFDED